MKSKIFVFTALILVLTFGFIYVNQNYLSSNDNDGKKECSNHSCNKHQKTNDKEIKAGGNEYSTYEFVTDKACCDEMKTSMQNELMGINGVKEVKFGESCEVSKMTKVSVIYSAGETNEEAITSFIKDKEYCPDNGNCPHGKCNMKKSKDTKNT